MRGSRLRNSVVTLCLLLICGWVCGQLLSQTTASPKARTDSRTRVITHPKDPSSHPAPAAATYPATSLLADPAKGAGSPVGRWIARHPSGEALSLWWNFREDGTVTATAGAIINSTYTLKGTMLTVAPASAGEPAGVFDVHFSDGRLIAHADHSPAMVFLRVGPETNSASAIVGTWKLSHAPHALDPEEEGMRTRMMEMIVVYGAGGSYHARIPVESFDGRWDASTRTYQLKNHRALPFERSGKGLTIATPPDGKETHLYFDDTLMDR